MPSISEEVVNTIDNLEALRPVQFLKKIAKIIMIWAKVRLDLHNRKCNTRAKKCGTDQEKNLYQKTIFYHLLILEKGVAGSPEVEFLKPDA